VRPVGVGESGRAVLPRVAFPLCAAVAIALLALPWLAEREVHASRRAALDGATPAAIDASRAAQRLTPWAASPRLQHALALEGSGDLHGAGSQIALAIERSPADWRLRLVQARIRRAAGDAVGGAAAMREARRLNPRSILLQGNPTQ
ncbi:MAG: hypothetical protein M3O90_01545, partial [Actinomycetota bacterium]|nr:hypothetical protein [Actinomycetota bacterium]